MDKRSGFLLDQDFGPIMAGKVELPNFQEQDLAKGVSGLACGSGLDVTGVNYAKVPGDERLSPQWARYFLNRTQGGAYDGTGYVMLYGKNGVGRIGKFAICEHVKETARDARPHIGWHPGHCTKCGLDMTVDSGD